MKQTMPRAMRKQLRLTEGRHQTEPTCDNCGLMTLVSSGSGTHRRCDAMGLYIPDWEMFPTCALHTRLNKTSRQLARHGLRWETTVIEEGGAL
ncbi:MAG: hypothetical protein IJ057_13375 [Bacteroidales bacterium]|nr:hypothetical protein [Bacteroidales bacterium]